MSRIGRKTGILFGLVAILAVVGVGSSLADTEVESKGKMRWVVVDDDGTKHEETIEFDGPRPFLGVGLERVRGGSGALIDSIVEDSAAAQAGLEEGDVVVGYNGDAIETPWDLTRAVLKSEAGERVDIEIERDGKSRTLSAELGEHEGWVGAFAFGEGDFDFNFENLGEPFRVPLQGLQFDAEQHEQTMEQLRERLENMNFSFGRPRLGVQLVNVTGELREHLGADPNEGVLVGRVLGDTPAEEAGVKVGDLIVAVGGETVAQRGDLTRLLRERDGETFNLDVIRDGRPMSLTVSLAELFEEVAPGRFQRRQRRHEERSDST